VLQCCGELAARVHPVLESRSGTHRGASFARQTS